MFYDRKCNDNRLNSNEPSAKKDDLLKQIETEDYEHYIKVEKLLKQIETENEKDTQESTINEVSEHNCEYYVTKEDLLKQIETEDYIHYVKVKKLLKQIGKETEKDMPETTKNESSKLACEHCGTTNNLFMFDCKRCKKRLCVRCRIPELHECVSVVWVSTDKCVKHYLNEYAMPEPDFQQRGKKV